MSQPAAKNEKRYTYGNYLGWPEGERWELIEGAPYDMTPAPSIDHQIIVGDLFRQISSFLLDKDCQVLWHHLMSDCPRARKLMTRS